MVRGCRVLGYVPGRHKQLLLDVEVTLVVQTGLEGLSLVIDDGLDVRQVGVVQRPALGYPSASSSGVLVAATRRGYPDGYGPRAREQFGPAPLRVHQAQGGVRRARAPAACHKRA